MSTANSNHDPAGRPTGAASSAKVAGNVAGDFDLLLGTLRRIRTTLDMDVIFVSEFTQGSRIFRCVDAASGETGLKIGEGGPLQDSYCQRIVDGRLPGVIQDAQTFPDPAALPASDIVVGGHLSVPIILQSGRVFGTLCCFSHRARPDLGENDLSSLRALADAIAIGIDEHGVFRASGWPP